MDHDARLIGANVIGYVIDDELGSDQIGAIYSAVQPSTGKRVAIKVLHTALATNAETVERIIHDVRALHHADPTIADIFAFGKLADGRSYLVMDLLAIGSVPSMVSVAAPRSTERDPGSPGLSQRLRPVSLPHPIQAENIVVGRESRVWLAVSLALVVIAAIALVVVLAS